MLSKLLRAARASKQSPIQQVITSLQQFNHAVTAGYDFVEEINCNGKDPLNIGLAISGGVDSMALASLCSRLQKDTGTPSNLSFRAFVVDHGVRPTSEDEASSVAKILESHNIPTSVLKITWPVGLDPKLSPKFESLARTFRFQALGRACRDHSITSLFLAHHEDDQAETLLMRLAKGHRKRGLLGMNVSASIPECHGIYGVDRSGGKPHLPAIAGAVPCPMKCEDGGVTIHRPLLSFTKAQLRETCKKHGMPWFEDHTNADPRITMRNAIRHIYARHSLPAALQKPSLLAMLNRLQKQKREAAQLRQDSWSSKLQIQLFDARLPLLSVRSEALTASEISDGQAMPILLDILRSTIQTMSSIENIEVESLIPVLVNIFPELRSRVSQCDGDQEPQPVATTFNKAGVQFTSRPLGASGASRTWLLTPEKAYRTRAPLLHIVPNHASPAEDLRHDPDSWHLWDGRYWINICNRTSQTLRLQHLSSVKAGTADVAQHNRKLLRQLRQSMGRYGQASLAVARHALFTITIEEDGRSTGKIIAFPTFGIVDKEYSERLKWTIRYKKVDAVQ